MSVEAALQEFTEKMEKNPEHIEDLTYTYEFRITDEKEGIYQLRIDQGKAEYSSSAQWEPKLVMEMKEEYFQKLANDDLNATMAYMSGKLKIKGDVSHALKFQSLIKKYQN
ncbi:SCP2 sterol-binding domain-containing protein [Alkalicoccus daliensis]|uniref:Putative sterol carrier protein n=1 Tax=Alkalicoccus daliensis TaxID=745820 RepID=A0A1H0DW88_9BACI|nr:SCP2 sterol-binding domain-containing protein [Alkalicoccus daliensis]SDN74349.1 Putative sterol carrier protein [Alkalicoccus daliensis]